MQPEMLSYVEMGRVLEAHNNRAYVRHKIDPLLKELTEAKTNRRDFGHYEDCGDSYHDRVRVVETEVQEAVTRKIEAEKYFRKLKLTFIEKYPTLKTVLEEELKKQSAVHGHAGTIDKI